MQFSWQKEKCKQMEKKTVATTSVADMMDATSAPMLLDRASDVAKSNINVTLAPCRHCRSYGKDEIHNSLTGNGTTYLGTIQAISTSSLQNVRVMK